MYNQKIREVEFSVHTVSSLAEEVTQESYYNTETCIKLCILLHGVFSGGVNNIS